MKVQTKIFGEIDINDDKIIVFPGGIIGFPEMTRFTLLFDEEKNEQSREYLMELTRMIGALIISLQRHGRRREEDDDVEGANDEPDALDAIDTNF